MRSEQFQLNADIELRHWWFTARRRILERLISKLLPVTPASLIVDIGCGTGGNVAELGKRYPCVGIDPSPEAIELAGRLYPAVQFICGMAPEDLGQLAGQARLFLMTDVLEHVREDKLLLSRLVSVTRPGSYFLVTVPANMSLWSAHDVSHGHYRRYTKTSFEQLWEGLPLDVELVSYFNATLYPVVAMVRRWNRLRGKTFGAADTDLKLPAAWINTALDRIFASEGAVLEQLLSGQRQRGYRQGVSLIAILRRQQEYSAAPKVLRQDGPERLKPSHFVPR